jgi:hypothetical protein
VESGAGLLSACAVERLVPLALEALCGHGRAVVGLARHRVVLIEAGVPGVLHGELLRTVVVAVDERHSAIPLGPDGAAVALDVAKALVEHLHRAAEKAKHLVTCHACQSATGACMSFPPVSATSPPSPPHLSTDPPDLGVPRTPEETPSILRKHQDTD